MTTGNESGTCPNCGQESDEGYDNSADPPEFDCHNENCRVEVFRTYE